MGVMDSDAGMEFSTSSDAGTSDGATAISGRFGEALKRKRPIIKKARMPASKGHWYFFSALANDFNESNHQSQLDDLEGFFPVRASTNSTHDAKRRFRFFESARWTTLLTSGETFVSGGAGILMICPISAIGLDAENGIRPERSWYARTPSAYWSVRPSCVWFSHCSGAIYTGVPLLP